MDAFVKSELSDGICTVEFFHSASNSLPRKILAEITEAITGAGNNDEVKVVILKSYGERAFCAGASFDELIAISNDKEGL